MPAKAGIQFLAEALGPRFRGDDRWRYHAAACSFCDGGFTAAIAVVRFLAE
jgi:hypothetical protein